MSTNGFPGKRVEAKRAGIIPTNRNEAGSFNEVGDIKRNVNDCNLSSSAVNLFSG